MGLGKSAMGQLGRYRMRRPARIAVVRPPRACASRLTRRTVRYGMIPGCSAAGSAHGWGPWGRRFESGQPDLSTFAPFV